MVAEAGTGVMATDEKLHVRTTELTELSRHLFQVAEDEKASLARELHDVFGSNLTAINMDLNWVARRLPADRPELADRLQRALRMLGQTVECKQQIIDRLRPSHLDTLGLTVAVREQCNELTQRTGVPCEVAADDDFEDLDASRSIALFRVAQGALADIEKHTHATQVRVALGRADMGIRLQISHDGVSEEPHESELAPNCELVSMRERVRACGGSFAMDQSANGSVVLDAFVPTESR